MTTVPQAAIDAAARAMDESFNPDRYPVMAAMFRDYAETALAAGLPFLSPVDVDGSLPTDAEEAQFVEEALACADSGQAGHWPTAAGYLADEVRRLRTLAALRLERLLEVTASATESVGAGAVEDAAKILATMTFAAHMPDNLPLWEDVPDATDRMRSARESLRESYLARSMPFAQALADAGLIGAHHRNGPACVECEADASWCNSPNVDPDRLRDVLADFIYAAVRPTLEGDLEIASGITQQATDAILALLSPQPAALSDDDAATAIEDRGALVAATTEGRTRYLGDEGSVERQAFVAGALWARRGLLSDDEAATAIETAWRGHGEWGMPFVLGLRLRGVRLIRVTEVGAR